MSNFKNTLKEFHLVGIIDLWQLKNYTKQYDSSTDEKKAALDKHAHLVLERSSHSNKNYKANIRSIKENVQFFAWLTIISLIIMLLAAIFKLATT